MRTGRPKITFMLTADVFSRRDPPAVAAQELYNLGWELRPVVIDDWGLGVAIDRYLQEWSQRTGIGSDLQSVGLERRRLGSQIESCMALSVNLDGESKARKV